MKFNKKIVFSIIGSLMMTFAFSSCETESERVRYNISQEADNFNIVRRVTIIDCITGDVLFQIIGLSDNVTYIVEDLALGENDVSQYHYTINFNPNMWLPYNAEKID